MAKKEEQIEEYNIFKCSCDNYTKEYESKEFIDHLKKSHNVEKMPGHRQMIIHMDGDTWFSSNYEWTLENNLVFMQYIKSKRVGRNFF